MGFLQDLLGSFKKNKFEKITKDDINKMRVNLATQEQELNDQFEAKLNAIDAIMESCSQGASWTVGLCSCRCPCCTWAHAHTKLTHTVHPGFPISVSQSQKLPAVRAKPQKFSTCVMY